MMNKISDFLAGIKVLEEAESPENGRITVIKSLAFGTYFQVGGLTQSGGIIKNIWSHSLRRVKAKKQFVKNVLVLGLGGGSIVQVIKKYWSDATITAVDIDEKIVLLGKKYLNFDETSVKVVISDASEFLIKSKPLKKKYDLICIDLYVGSEFPKKFENVVFIDHVIKRLNPNGIAVFNRLYYGEKRPQSVKFGNLLDKIFRNVDYNYPEANVMFICYK